MLQLPISFVPTPFAVATLMRKQGLFFCSAVTAVEPPGPGFYEPITGNEVAHSHVSKSVGPTSPFSSKTARSVMFSRKAMLNKPPGPAFYKPHQPVDHRSFHFGAVKNSFIPAGAGISDLDLTKQRAPVSSC